MSHHHTMPHRRTVDRRHLQAGDGPCNTPAVRPPPPSWAAARRRRCAGDAAEAATALHCVVIVRGLCQLGREPLVRRAVEEGVVPAEGLPDLVTAVATSGTLLLLRYLFGQRGMDPNQTDARQYMQLHSAFCSESDRKALYLIDEAGADVNVPFKDGTTPLMLAAARGFVKV